MTQAPVAQSPLQNTFAKLGATIDSNGPWQVAAHFGAANAELKAAQTGVAIGELTGAGIIEIAGATLDKVAEKLKVGTVATGGVVPLKLKDGEGARWARLTRSQARVLTPPNGAEAALGAIKTAGAGHAIDLSSGLVTFVLTGPKAPDVLARLARLDLDPRAFADHTLLMTGSVGIGLHVVRWDRGSTLAYELTVGRDLAEYFWDSVFHAGEDLGLRPMGATALAQLGSNA